jgi:hypothetical protein
MPSLIYGRPKQIKPAQSLIDLAVATALATVGSMGVRHPQRPAVQRPAAARRSPKAATVSPRKRAAGDKVIAAFGRLQAAQVRADEALSSLMDASSKRRANQGRSGQLAHELRLAHKDAAALAEAASQALEAARTEYAAAVRKFYRT